MKIYRLLDSVAYRYNWYAAIVIVCGFWFDGHLLAYLKKDFLGVTASDKTITVTGFDLFRISEGKLAEMWQQWNIGSWPWIKIFILFLFFRDWFWVIIFIKIFSTCMCQKRKFTSIIKLGCVTGEVYFWNSLYKFMEMDTKKLKSHLKSSLIN